MTTDFFFYSDADTRIHGVFSVSGTRIHGAFSVGGISYGYEGFKGDVDGNADNLLVNGVPLIHSSVAQPHLALTAHRDDLRGGWFIVSVGVRYIVAHTALAGQPRYTPVGGEKTAMAYAQAANAGSTEHIETIARSVRNSTLRLAQRGWCVLDLHNLGVLDLHNLGVAPARYAVVYAAAAEADEPGYWCDSEGVPFDICKKLNANVPLKQPCNFVPFEQDQARRVPRWPVVAGVVDLQDDWHRARRARAGNVAVGASAPPTEWAAPIAPSGPSTDRDRAICAAWEEKLQAAENDITRAMTQHDSRCPVAAVSIPTEVEVDGVKTTRADYDKARKSELGRRCAPVPVVTPTVYCQGTHPEDLLDHEADDAWAWC